ncbi:MAG: peptidoglycan DD-metalloendopeptidase family protein [Bryobacterales bacterium]
MRTLPLLVLAACEPAATLVGTPGEALQPTAFALPLAERGDIANRIGVDHDPVVQQGLTGSTVCTDYVGRAFPYCYDEHTGTDLILRGGFARMDAGSIPVLAAADGVVVEVVDGHYDRCHTDGGEVTCDGHPIVANKVVIEHADGLRSRYLHLKQDSVKVEVGDEVRCGEVLALVGSSGNSSMPHLHFEVNDLDGYVVDPFAGPWSQAESRGSTRARTTACRSRRALPDPAPARPPRRLWPAPAAAGGAVRPGRALPLVQPSTDRRRWYVPMQTAALGPVVWFVDTGYTWSTCDDDLVEALGLEPRGRVRVHGELGGVVSGKVELPPMEMGGHRVEALRCQVRDLGTTSSLDDPDEVPIAGVLGMDLLRRFRVVFDPQRGEMVLLDPGEAPPLSLDDPGATRIRRAGFRGNRALVRFRVGDRGVWQILDTGATNTYVDGARLDLRPSYTMQNVTVRATGATGSQVRQLVSYEVGDAWIGEHAVGSVTLIDRDRGWWVPGLLGLDLLGRFHQEYDFDRNLVRLTPSRVMPLPQFSAWWDDRRPPPSTLLDGEAATDGLSDRE